MIEAEEEQLLAAVRETRAAADKARELVEAGRADAACDEIAEAQVMLADAVADARSDARSRNGSEPAPVQRVRVYGEAEDVLASLLLSGNYGPEMSAKALADVRAEGVTAASFERGRDRAIYSAIETVVDRGEPALYNVVEAELATAKRLDAAGGKVYLVDLARSALAVENVRHYARIVVGHARARADERFALRMLEAARNGGVDDTLRSELAEQLRAPGAWAPGTRLVSQPWSTFTQATPDAIDWLVRGLITPGAFVFVASPPKKGKTWVMIDLGLAVALARRFLARFDVDTARPVLLVLLEGHRAAVRDRVGAMARGAGIDPDGPELDLLHITYKPPGINLSDPGWAADLRAEAADLDAALVGVDVLRAAARMKSENSGDDFAILRDNLRPLTDEGRVVALAHHFGKLTELSKERSPGERMTGSGAMYGAMDLGVFITGSDNGARTLRVEFDGRDSAMPDPVGVRLLGAGSGENGSLTYADAAHFVAEDVPDPDDLKAPASEIAAWIRGRGGHAAPGEIRDAFTISEATLRKRRDDLAPLGIAYIGTGKSSRYEDLGNPDDPAPRNPALVRGNPSRGQEPHEQADLPRNPAHPAPEPAAGYYVAIQSLNCDPAVRAPLTWLPPASRETPDEELAWA